MKKSKVNFIHWREINSFNPGFEKRFIDCSNWKNEEIQDFIGYLKSKSYDQISFSNTKKGFKWV